MTSESFYELCHKLNVEGREPSEGFLVLDEFVRAYRDVKKAKPSLDEWETGIDECLQEVANSTILFATAISNWLLEDVELAKALVHKASVRHLQQKVAVTYDLSNIDKERAILTGCQLCAINATPAVSLGWTLSLHELYPASEKINRAVAHLLQYHVEEFPRTTKRVLSSEQSPFKKLKIVNEVLAILEKQEKWLEELPRLREFAMTPEMQLTLFSLKRSENREINRYAEKTSIFRQFCTSRRFKYSRKTAVEFVVGDKMKETALEMSRHSTWLELPLSERTDPVSGNDRRLRLWEGVLQ